MPKTLGRDNAGRFALCVSPHALPFPLSLSLVMKGSGVRVPPSASEGAPLRSGFYGPAVLSRASVGSAVGTIGLDGAALLPLNEAEACLFAAPASAPPTSCRRHKSAVRAALEYVEDEAVKVATARPATVITTPSGRLATAS